MSLPNVRSRLYTPQSAPRREKRCTKRRDKGWFRPGSGCTPPLPLHHHHHYYYQSHHHLYYHSNHYTTPTTTAIPTTTHHYEVQRCVYLPITTTTTTTQGKGVRKGMAKGARLVCRQSGWCVIRVARYTPATPRCTTLPTPR